MMRQDRQGMLDYLHKIAHSENSHLGPMATYENVPFYVCLRFLYMFVISNVRHEQRNSSVMHQRLPTTKVTLCASGSCTMKS